MINILRTWIVIVANFSGARTRNLCYGELRAGSSTARAVSPVIRFSLRAINFGQVMGASSIITPFQGHHFPITRSTQPLRDKLVATTPFSTSGTYRHNDIRQLEDLLLNMANTSASHPWFWSFVVRILPL